MPIIVQLCIVIVTVAVSVMAFMALRLILRLDGLIHAVENGFLHLQETMSSLRRTSDQIHTMLDTLEPAAETVRDGAEMLHGVAGRAARMSHALLDEVELPLRGTVALMRGLRAGTRILLNRWSTRSHNGNYQPNRGGHDV